MGNRQLNQVYMQVLLLKNYTHISKREYYMFDYVYFITMIDSTPGSEPAV